MLLDNSGGTSGRSRPRAPMAEINIIPLVDVMLVLLIIFMVTTAFVKDSGLNLKLPPAKTSEAGAQNSGDLLIALGQNNQITLDGLPATEAQIGAAMRLKVQKNPRTHVTIKGDGRIAYARIVRIMDLARQSGLKSVSLGTRLPEAVQ
ncbi:biopolymer transport protein ExbD/biopolymer transport protein TolR [Abditibacterium utsteinense]|uniref:Biopolymer transport protein ExbD/biopolymer transport protein TolR n=2 Tax=Abditibacterium utsteinense TaxID=1960156 RepID=A0A2S8SSI5_9BACT|nr:biopolymer transport protein ExbD/biopolymer transport protein TolR [Abditibacterium utsteinense]